MYATRRSVRVVYQVFDAAGNTRVQPPFARLHATKEGTCGTKDGPCEQHANCDRPDATSGIGECKLEVRPDFFSSDGDTTASLHLTLNRDELPPFATVSLAKATVAAKAPEKAGAASPPGEVSPAWSFVRCHNDHGMRRRVFPEGRTIICTTCDNGFEIPERESTTY